MSDKIPNFDFYNKILEKKSFYYEGPLFHFTDTVPIKFNYKIKILGIVKKIVIGEWKEFLNLEVDVFDAKPITTAEIFFTKENIIQEHLNRILTQDIRSFLPFLGLEKYFVHIEKINIMDNINKLNESSSERRNVVREVVKDIISMFKKGEGEYSLPEDLTGDIGYDFHNLKTLFNVELKITESESIDGFDLDGGYYDDDDTFEIDIIYNPKYFPEHYYDLIGELNELFRHELQHLIQMERGVERPKTELPPEQYYLQPHEIDAQIQGFKRLSKIRKEPFEKIVRDWYYKNNSLDDKAKERVIKTVLSQYK